MLNLDTMDSEDLRAACKALRQLAEYAEILEMARCMRQDGRIPEAIACERGCDRIYASLPAGWRW